MDVRMALRIEHGANPARGEIVTIRKFSGIPGGRWSDEPAGDGGTVAGRLRFTHHAAASTDPVEAANHIHADSTDQRPSAIPAANAAAIQAIGGNTAPPLTTRLCQERRGPAMTQVSYCFAATSSMMRAANVSRGIGPRSPAPRLRTATWPLLASLSPTTSM